MKHFHSLRLRWVLVILHCVKSVQIGSFFWVIFLVFWLNKGKYVPEKLRVWTLFTQCFFNKCPSWHRNIQLKYSGEYVIWYSEIIRKFFTMRRWEIFAKTFHLRCLVGFALCRFSLHLNYEQTTQISYQKVNTMHLVGPYKPISDRSQIFCDFLTPRFHLVRLQKCIYNPDTNLW